MARKVGTWSENMQFMNLCPSGRTEICNKSKVVAGIASYSVRSRGVLGFWTSSSSCRNKMNDFYYYNVVIIMAGGVVASCSSKLAVEDRR